MTNPIQEPIAELRQVTKMFGSKSRQPSVVYDRERVDHSHSRTQRSREINRHLHDARP